MLKWDAPEVIAGLTTYWDDTELDVAYLLPSTPRFRTDGNGKPVFRFMKYKFPISREDGKKGGGFLVCDVEFGVTDEQRAIAQPELDERVKQRWQAAGRSGTVPPAKIGQLNYVRGTASVTVLDSGGALVEKVVNPASPSLYGNMILPVTVELSPEGATLLESALQEEGGVVQVAYDLWTPVKLPPVTAHVWFTARKAATFHQEIDVDEVVCGADEYTEKIVELIIQSDSGNVEIDPGTVTDQKVIQAVTDWAWQTLADATTRMVLGDVPLQNSEQIRKLYTEQDFEHIDFHVLTTRLVDFDRTYTQNQVMEWNPAPRGTLPNITAMTGPDGERYKWEDFATEVDLDDAFFRTMRVNVRTNADFERLPIHSVEVKVEYDPGGENRVEEYALTSPDDTGTFECFLSNNSRRYTYTYQVNYQGESEAFVSEPKASNDPSLIINVGDIGVLDLEIKPGDLNFDQVRSAQVSLWYQDGGVPRIQTSVTVDKDNPEHRWTEVIFAPRRQPVFYKVKYFMIDGREFEGSEQSTGSSDLWINDPFSATRTIQIRGFGDFENRIDAIFVDLKYVDDVNNYSQEKSITLTASSTFEDWTFPAILADGGRLTYASNLRFKDGTVKTIPETLIESNTVMIGETQLQQEVTVIADLVDWTAVKLVKVTLRHQSDGVEETDDLLFKADSASPQVWKYAFESPSKKAYSWSATYFMADNTSGFVDAADVTDETIVLPAAPA